MAERQRGFTLIEMMIVVAIIAILVTILVPNFMRARAQAQTAACEGNLKEIATALELYETDHDAYPQSGTIDSNNSDLQPYLQQTPIDPAAGPGKPYTFSVSTDAAGEASYAITCPGLHDPATLQAISQGATGAAHIQIGFCYPRDWQLRLERLPDERSTAQRWERRPPAPRFFCCGSSRAAAELAWAMSS
jgi:type II secretion system protein G